MVLREIGSSVRRRVKREITDHQVMSGALGEKHMVRDSERTKF